MHDFLCGSYRRAPELSWPPSVAPLYFNHPYVISHPPAFGYILTNFTGNVTTAAGFGSGYGQNGGPGSVNTPSCPPGSGGLLCKICPPGFFSNTTTTLNCSVCTNRPEQ